MPGKAIIFELDGMIAPILRHPAVADRCAGFVTVTRAARAAALWLLGQGVPQITEKDRLAQDTYYQGRINVIDTVRTIAAGCGLDAALIRLGDSPLYAGLAQRILIPSVESEAFMAPFLAAHAAETGADTVWTAAPAESFGAAGARTGLRFRSELHTLTRMVRWGQRLASAAAVLGFPLLNVVHLWRKGVRPGRPAAAAPRPALLVHREPDLRDSSIRYRDMYFLNHGLLDPARCHHTPMATSQLFSAAKRAHLEAIGASILECRNLRPGWRRFLDLAVIRPLRHGPALARAILSCPSWRWRSTIDLMETVHFTSLTPLLLDQGGTRTVITETEVSPFAQVIAIEIRKRGGRAISMLHGAGGQNTQTPPRTQMQFTDLITYGHWYTALQQIAPAIQRYIPCGNIEIDHLDLSGACLPAWVRDNRGRLRLIAFLARLDHVLTNTVSAVTHSPHLDEARHDAIRRAEFEPLLRWVAETPDVVLVWKTGLGGFADSARREPDGTWRIAWRPWIAPLIAAIPPERFVYLERIPLEQVVGICDVALCNDVSSAFPCVMSAGKPALSIDYVFGGLMGRRYHPRVAATSGAEILANTRWLLNTPLPDSVYLALNRDFYGMDRPDFNAAGRVRAVFTTALAEDGTPQPEA